MARTTRDENTDTNDTSGQDAPEDAVTALDRSVSEEGVTSGEVKDDTPPNIASPAENAALEHSDETKGTTTRSDATDVGVPMLPGDPKERVGPEDALGEGPTRGDYRGRIGPSGYEPTTTERIPDAEPGEPHTRVVAQRPHAEEIGDAPGKGGVDVVRDADQRT